MKKIVLGLLMITTFSGNAAFAGKENVWTLDRLNNESPRKFQAEKDGWEYMDGLASDHKGSKTITLIETKEEVEQQEGNIYKDTFVTAAKWGAAAAGLGLTYLYGPTALFWGTYYGSSYLLGKLGIAGITGVSAATKAAIMVADSPAAQTALTAAGGLVAKYGATAAVKTAELVGSGAMTGAKYAASGVWSLGSYAYNSFWGSASSTKVEEKEPTKKEMRELMLRAVEQRQVQKNIEQNLASLKVQQVLGLVN